MAAPPRVRLWELSREIVYRLIVRVHGLKDWNRQTLYLASQLNTIAMIVEQLEHEDGKVKVGNVLLLRVAMDCVVNAIAGCNEPVYADNALAEAKIPRAERGFPTKAQRDLFKKYSSSTWIADNNEPNLLFARANALIHGDADAGFYLRADGLGAIDIKGLTMCVLALMQGVRPYLTGLGAYFSNEEFNDIVTQLKEVLLLVASEGNAYYNQQFGAFEARVYKELFKVGVNLKLSEPLRTRDQGHSGKIQL
jgi:hypothetical protein